MALLQACHTSKQGIWSTLQKSEAWKFNRKTQELLCSPEVLLRSSSSKGPTANAAEAELREAWRSLRKGPTRAPQNGPAPQLPVGLPACLEGGGSLCSLPSGRAHGLAGRFPGKQTPGPQKPPSPKDARITHSSGQSFQQLRQQCLQKGVLFEDADFPANSSSLFYSKKPQIPFVWKRPGEIVKSPEFILGGATRTDICQGELGDCWLLAAIASLTLNKKALVRVVPHDQNFGSDYAGIFHFQFWQHSEWLDVVIDDRLPTFRDRLIFLHSADHNEFWSALLEKAYAKLNGSYEALKGGSTIEAMEDFTGGVAETFTTKEAPENFYEILEKALKWGSLVGCSIHVGNTAESEARTPSGLIKGHAYTVTGIDQVNFQGRKTEMIRVRNPWGHVEWNGSWSDSSSEWRSVSLAEQKRLCHTALDDGEFWMAFADFKAHFDKVEVCNLTPDALEEGALHRWEVAVHHGSWVRGSTAGGCRNFLDTFWTNPQIKLSLTEKDEGQEECNFLVALMQKDRRKLKKFGAEVLTIGYAIYQCPGKDQHLNKDFFRYHTSQAKSKTFINLREVSERFKLPPGEYILIPSTFEPHQEADFCLRIFSEKKAITWDMDGNIDIDLPEPQKPTPPAQETEEEQQFRALFERVAGEDMAVTAEELQCILNAEMQAKKNIQFKKLSLISCKNIISLMDTSCNGKLEFDEFKVLWDKLKKWIDLFLQFDADKSGTMSSYELRIALKAAGFQLNSRLLQLTVLRYTDETLQLGFDDFLNCLVRLENASRVFQALSMKDKESMHLNINEVCPNQTFAQGSSQG
ncbi:PREDICTED: calpain-9 [Condylura cristata]|uniref:calpain-9 n=1 Tax=Condylura cristata TaxID=143302 RepID=UPI0006428AD4|nr:PREDICTED: calpain-9 [Condylura cristata]